MEIVNASSLAATLDAVNDALFCGRRLPKSQREEAAKWIAGRQGKPGSYAGMFAPTDRDFSEGIRLFTGERFATRAGTAHVLGEEACRALILLNVRTKDVRDALSRATAGMLIRLRDAVKREKNMGRPWLGQYCCGKCTVALWRHLAVGGLENAERHLAAGMRGLRLLRTGDGKWRRLPSYYTLLALSEIGLPTAVREMRYAAPTCERILNRLPKDNAFDRRRRAVAESVELAQARARRHLPA